MRPHNHMSTSPPCERCFLRVRPLLSLLRHQDRGDLDFRAYFPSQKFRREGKCGAREEGRLESKEKRQVSRVKEG
jgi:hypothetical protein